MARRRLIFDEKAVEVKHLVSWRRAWKASGAMFGWCIVWGIIGLIIIGAGGGLIAISVIKYAPSVSSITSSINSSLNSTKPSLPNLSSNFSGFRSSGFIFGVLGGVALMFVGDIFIVLGVMASFFKISAETTAQEVQQRTSETPR